MKLSICIPTYNRSRHLENCLSSIAASLVLANPRLRGEVEVCISDNASPDATPQVVARFADRLPLTSSRNPQNLGIPRNFLKVVSLARGDFVWLLGDDDLLLPDAIQSLCDLLGAHPEADFFYINSCHLSTEYVFSHPQPFDTANLPREMQPFSSWPHSARMPFLDLVDPRFSFDFLGGMFLAVFRRSAWLRHAGVLDQAAIMDQRLFSHFDNTFPHVKIFASAFAGSKAYFHARPLSVCLTGAREWAPMYQLVKSVRLVEALEEYRSKGLPFLRYWRCRNYALRNFLPDLVSMFVRRPESGFGYVSPIRLIIANCLYPNFYLSLPAFLVRKARLGLRRIASGVSR